MGRRNAIKVEPCRQRVGVECRWSALGRPPLQSLPANRLGEPMKSIMGEHLQTAARDNAEPGRTTRHCAQISEEKFCTGSITPVGGVALLRCDRRREALSKVKPHLPKDARDNGWATAGRQLAESTPGQINAGPNQH